MKRRRVSVREQTKLSARNKENASSIPNSQTSAVKSMPGAEISHIHGTLNSVFEILLPLEAKDMQVNQKGAQSQPSKRPTNTRAGNERNLEQKPRKSHFHTCLSCGRSDKHCKCLSNAILPSKVVEKLTSKPEVATKEINQFSSDGIIVSEFISGCNENSDEIIHEKKGKTHKGEECFEQCAAQKENAIGKMKLNKDTDKSNSENEYFKHAEGKEEVENYKKQENNYTSEPRKINENDNKIENDYSEILQVKRAGNLNKGKNSFNGIEMDSDIDSANKSTIDIKIFSKGFESFIDSDSEFGELLFDVSQDSLRASESQCKIICYTSECDMQDKKKHHATIRKCLTNPQLATSEIIFSKQIELDSMAEGSFKSQVDPQKKIVEVLPSEEGDHAARDEIEVFEQMDQDDIHFQMSQKADFSVLVELREADEKSKRTAHLIDQIKESIKKFQSKENLSEEDTLVIKIKQVELQKKLAEFEEITQRVRKLVGMAELSHSKPTGQVESTLHSSSLESLDLPPSLTLDVIPEQDECKSRGEETSKVLEGEDTDNDEKNKEAEIPEIDNTKKNTIDNTEVELLNTRNENKITSVLKFDKFSSRKKDDDLSKFFMMDRVIPKVIVCGTENRMPRIILCEQMNEGSPKISTSLRPPPLLPEFPPFKPAFSAGNASTYQKKKEAPDLMISLTGRLSESYSLQEKLAKENAQLEDGRYCLQEELLKRDSIVDALHKQVGSLQTEMRVIAKENSILQDKLEELSNMDPCACGNKKMTMGGKQPNCLQQYSNTTSQLERQLNQIEGEVRNMQNELQQVQRERQQLEQQRKLIKCSGPGQAARVGVGGGGGGGTCMPATCPNPSAGRERGESAEQALRELKEQYTRLQDDFKSKVTETSSLRREVDKLKSICDDAKDAQVSAEQECKCIQSQLKAAEYEKKKMQGSKEQMMEQEQQLSVAKQRFREAQDELEELRALIQDQTTQLEDYRNKYLQAQQQVEEQRRQIDVMEMENSRISDQVNLEIQRVKAQFQEKLQELTPLPDILKATQLKLQECQQCRLLAERNCEELARDLQEAKDKFERLAMEMDEALKKGPDERDSMQSKLDSWEKKCSELKEENAKLRTDLVRVDEIASQNQRRLEEKLHEATQLAAQLETVREESARQVARTKDRCETMRRSLQCQISELERQLAQSRAAARTAQKDRDEIRQRMQCQINNLNESFEQAQMRIRSLQSHVNFLKSSYTNIFEGNSMLPDCACPNAATYNADTCDCNF